MFTGRSAQQCPGALLGVLRRAGGDEGPGGEQERLCEVVSARRLHCLASMPCLAGDARILYAWSVPLPL